MKIFIAGASGAIGHPLVKRLQSDGHEVFGMTRSKERAQEIADLGATPVVADALNALSVQAAIKRAQPEVVVDMLTSLPKTYTPQSMREASVIDKKLRTEGGAILQKASEEAGARRYILQSSAFWYAPGPGLADEKTPFAFDASPGISAGAKVYAEIENRVLQARSIEGVALRFGFFYGPGTWFEPHGDAAEQVRRRERYIIDGGHGVWNFVHIEDAAAGIALALNCATGVYNITNDSPVEQSVWLPAFARWLGAPPPLARTKEEEERINGPDSVYYATSLRGASNAKAKRELNFQPRLLEWITI